MNNYIIKKCNHFVGSVLDIWILPFLAARQLGFPPGTNTDRFDVPMFTATQVLQTMPAMHRTCPNPLSKK